MIMEGDVTTYTKEKVIECSRNSLIISIACRRVQYNQ